MFTFSKSWDLRKLLKRLREHSVTKAVLALAQRIFSRKPPEDTNQYGITRAIASRAQRRATNMYGDIAYREAFWRKLTPESLWDQARKEADGLDRNQVLSTTAIHDLVAWASRPDLPFRARRMLMHMLLIDMTPPEDDDDPRWTAYESLERFADLVDEA